MPYRDPNKREAPKSVGDLQICANAGANVPVVAGFEDTLQMNLPWEGTHLYRVLGPVDIHAIAKHGLTP